MAIELSHELITSSVLEYVQNLINTSDLNHIQEAPQFSEHHVHSTTDKEKARCDITGDTCLATYYTSTRRALKYFNGTVTSFQLKFAILSIRPSWR
jgi:hypothetical protein